MLKIAVFQNVFPTKSLIFLLLGLLLLWGLAGSGQTALPLFKPYGGVAVEKGNRQLTTAFAGGLASAQFAMADLDNDGRSDLVIFSATATAQRIRTFRNKGTAGNPEWVYEPRFAQAFPENTKGFLKLLDYNCDGIPDLFHNGSQSLVGESRVNVRPGYYNSNNELQFTPYKDLYYSKTDFSKNVYVANEDEPGIADVDGDGDLDIVAYSTEGGAMYYYRNYQAERGLPCDSIVLELEAKCWGLVGQGTQRSFYRKKNSYNCIDDPTPVPSFLKGNLSVETAAKTLHGNNTVCLLDIDGDGDLDVLNSNLAYSDMQLQVNGKSGSGNSIDSVSSQDTLWQKGGKKVLIPGFPTAYFLDIDGDGKKDIVVAPRHDGNAALDRNHIWLYRNTGSNSSPNFQFQKDSLLVEDMIDGGSNSHPLFYDFNKDGKPDILMGSTATLPGAGIQNQLHYYENISTGGLSRYRFVTSNLANVSSLSQTGCAPAIADIDGDGKDDLLIGLKNGQFAFYKNEAATDTSLPVWRLKQAALKNPDGTVLEVPQNAAPVLYDINHDGLPDIVAGSLEGRLTAFINTNVTQGVPRFGLRKDSLGGAGVVVDPFNSSRVCSTPYIGPIDSSGELFLVMGSNSGLLYAWRGIGSGNINTAYTLVSSDFSGIRMPTESAPAFGDMDGDGTPEMLVGNSWGGLFLYGIKGTLGIADAPAGLSLSSVLAFPNPVASHLVLRRENQPAVLLSFRLCTLMGQVVAQGTLPAGTIQTQLEVAHLPAGLYLLQVQGPGLQETLKIAIVH